MACVWFVAKHRGRRAVNPIGALIEVISRRAGLDNVGDEAVGKTEEDRDGKPQDQVATAEPGPGAADRAPIGAVADPEPTGPPAPLTDSVNPQTSPGPSAGMAPQETKLGEGVHVGG